MKLLLERGADKTIRNKQVRINFTFQSLDIQNPFLNCFKAHGLHVTFYKFA